eukprot:5869341-Prymnesium_polylepis.1
MFNITRRAAPRQRTTPPTTYGDATLHARDCALGVAASRASGVTCNTMRSAPSRSTPHALSRHDVTPLPGCHACINPRARTPPPSNAGMLVCRSHCDSHRGALAPKSIAARSVNVSDSTHPRLIPHPPPHIENTWRRHNVAPAVPRRTARPAATTERPHSALEPQRSRLGRPRRTQWTPIALAPRPRTALAARGHNGRRSLTPCGRAHGAARRPHRRLAPLPRAGWWCLVTRCLVTRCLVARCWVARCLVTRCLVTRCLVA